MNIDVEELCVGNLLIYKEKIVKVTSIHFIEGLMPIVYISGYNKKTNICVKLDTLSPLPLSDELLVAFGFTKKKHYGFNIFYKGDFTVDPFMSNVSWKGGNILDCKYAHQIQNLSLILAKQKLNIDLGK